MLYLFPWNPIYPAITAMVLGAIATIYCRGRVADLQCRMSFRINRLQASTALMLFLVYAGLLGLMLSSVFLAYTATSVTRTFFIAAVSSVRLACTATPW